MRAQSSRLSLVLTVVAIMLVAVLVLYRQPFVTGSSPGAPVWIFATIAVVIVALRAAARRR